MDMTQNVAEWLNWLSRVRFFLITLLLALVLVLGKTSQLEVSTLLFLPLMIRFSWLATFSWSRALFIGQARRTVTSYGFTRWLSSSRASFFHAKPHSSS